MLKTQNKPFYLTNLGDNIIKNPETQKIFLNHFLLLSKDQITRIDC